MCARSPERRHELVGKTPAKKAPEPQRPDGSRRLGEGKSRKALQIGREKGRRGEVLEVDPLNSQILAKNARGQPAPALQRRNGTSASQGHEEEV